MSSCISLSLDWCWLFCICEGQYQHACIYCSKSFLTSYALKLHLRSHTQERPFCCCYSDCHKAFNTIYRSALNSLCLFLLVLVFLLYWYSWMCVLRSPDYVPTCLLKKIWGRSRGYNKNCIFCPWIWVDEINFCCFICVINNGPYPLL